jgi:intracellular septation protein A
MTAIQDTVVAPSRVLTRTSRPPLKAVVARVAASVATAVIVPAVLFWATFVTFDIDTAVIVALAWMAGATCWRWATKRPVSGLLVLTLGIMTIRTGVMLATGNTFVYFVQPVGGDAIVAAIFLGSLWTARPIVARLAPDFYPIDPALAARPRVRKLFQRLTLLWGLVIVVKGSVTLWLLMTLSTANFVLIKSSAIITLTLLAAGTTVALSAIVGRREGLLQPSG